MTTDRFAERPYLSAAAGLAAVLLLIGLYLVVASLGRAPGGPLAALWENWRSALPLALGFGVQVGLYTLLRKGLRRPIHVPAGRTTTAASGGSSALAMVACCAPAAVNLLPNVLPWLGLTAASTLFAQWRMPFMVLSIVSNAIGLSVMIYAVLKARGINVGNLIMRRRAGAS